MASSPFYRNEHDKHEAIYDELEKSEENIPLSLRLLSDPTYGKDKVTYDEPEGGEPDLEENQILRKIEIRLHKR